MTNTGACDLTTYNTLTFEQDSVRINYSSEIDCYGDPSKVKKNSGYVNTYPYKIKSEKPKGGKNDLQIIGYEVLNRSFEIYPEKLIEITKDSSLNKKNILSTRLKLIVQVRYI